MVVAYVQNYQFDNTDLDVIYDVECDDGANFQETAKTTLQAARYGQTHFLQKHGIFKKPEDCTSETNDCIQSINGKKALKASELEKEFENCFKGKGTFSNATIIASKPSRATTLYKPSFITYIFIFLSSIVLTRSF